MTWTSTVLNATSAPWESTPPDARRGATFLEYAILAGGVVIGGLLVTALRSPLEGLFSKIGGLVSGAAG